MYGSLTHKSSSADPIRVLSILAYSKTPLLVNQSMFTTYSSVDLVCNMIFHAKVGKGGTSDQQFC